MGLSDSYSNRKRQESNAKASKFVKDQGCMVVMLIGFLGSITLGVGIISVFY